jgi:hypothetical protein
MFDGFTATKRLCKNLVTMTDNPKFKEIMQSNDHIYSQTN